MSYQQLPVFTGPHRVYRCPEFVCMKLNDRQLLWNQENRQPSSAEVLLITDAAIGGDEQIEQRFCQSQQITVIKVRPAHFEGSGDFVFTQEQPHRTRRAVVQEDLHAETASFGERTAARVSWARKSRNPTTCSRLTPSNQSTNSSTVAPLLRFDKSASTGTRVPRNTQAPLSFPGRLSTIGHFDRSIILAHYNRTPQAVHL
jgi:hypothetical protein